MRPGENQISFARNLILNYRAKKNVAVMERFPLKAVLRIVRVMRLLLPVTTTDKFIQITVQQSAMMLFLCFLDGIRYCKGECEKRFELNKAEWPGN